jgi:AcrR family transcriptional regulator
MLNMCSAKLRLDDPDDDRTTRARIRDAAMARFARHGVAGASLRAVAEDAGVSPALVIHHFGSKEGLRRACDQHAAAVIREGKREAVAGAAPDPLAALRGRQPQVLSVTAYLARTLIDGSDEVNGLVDEIVADAASYSEEYIRAGIMKPSDDVRARAVVLAVWSLGALVLSRHLERLLGADIMGEGDDAMPYLLPATEILAKGALAESLYDDLRRAIEVSEHAKRGERDDG